MMSIAFSWTTKALLAGVKTVTRRDWDDNYAKRFKPGDIVDAYDKGRMYGGKKIAKIRIESVEKEKPDGPPKGDYEAEGIPWLITSSLKKLRDELPKTEEEFIAWCREEPKYVVRFTLVEVLSDVKVITNDTK